MLLFLKKAWGGGMSWGSLLLWPLGQRLGQGSVVVH